MTTAQLQYFEEWPLADIQAELDFMREVSPRLLGHTDIHLLYHDIRILAQRVQDMINEREEEKE